MATSGAVTRFLRRFGALSSDPLRVCIVGSGPAGFYTAEKVIFLIYSQIITKRRKLWAVSEFRKLVFLYLFSLNWVFFSVMPLQIFKLLWARKTERCVWIGWVSGAEDSRGSPSWYYWSSANTFWISTFWGCSRSSRNQGNHAVSIKCCNY